MTTEFDLNVWIRENLFDVVPVAIAVINPDFDVVYANKAFERMFGAWQNRKCYHVYKKRDSFCSGCKGIEAFKNGASSVNREVGTNKSGRLTYYVQHTFPIVTEDGNVPFLVEIATDITETEQIKKEHRLLFEEVPCSILILDKNFRIVKTNKKIRTAFGDLTGQHCYKALKGLDRKCSECTAGQTFTDGEMHIGQHLWKSQAGEQINSLITTVPLRMEDNSFNLVMEMAVDITQTLKLEQEKLEAERLAAVGQTVAGLAHGVKNLMTGLEGGMYMLNSGLKTSNPDRIEKGTEMLNRNIERVSAFVTEFLSFSKGRTIHVEPVHPAKIAEEVVDMYASKARELGIDLINEATGDIPPANLDSNGIHECLTNLIGNAIDACRMSEETDKCHVRVKTYENNGIITYEVVDDGCGMDYDVKKKVFTNFFTTKGSGGHGLGLLMTKKIIQEHGGKIDLESEPGQGATLRILLPRDRLPKPVES